MRRGTPRFASPRSSRTRGRLRIQVGDEGPGVAPALRERVFEKFYRVPGREPADPKRAGIGLGLSIARRLVEAQGGRMWIEAARPSGGTAVMMTLPGALGRAAGRRCGRRRTIVSRHNLLGAAKSDGCR